MLLEEFENTSAVIEPTDASIRGGGETCNTTDTAALTAPCKSE